MKIAAVYTGAGVIDMISALLKKEYPEYEIMNILDDTLIKQCIKDGGLTANVLRRLCNIYQYAYEAGAGVILTTCSSVGEAAYTARKILPVPVLRIDEPMARLAAEKFKRIGVIATLSTTLDPTCRLVEKQAKELGKDITIVRGLAEGAYEEMVAGRGENHDKIIAETANALSCRCDAFVLAQASMARMEKQLSEASGKPVYSSPATGVTQIKDYI